MAYAVMAMMEFFYSNFEGGDYFTASKPLFRVSDLYPSVLHESFFALPHG